MRQRGEGPGPFSQGGRARWVYKQSVDDHLGPPSVGMADPAGPAWPGSRQPPPSLLTSSHSLAATQPLLNWVHGVCLAVVDATELSWAE